MSGINTASLAKFSANLRRLPTVLGQKIATAAAPALTEAANATFSAGEDAYGGSWAPREDGTRATLVKSGALASKIHYVAIGTKIRVALGATYAKFVIGKRPVFPKQGEPLPASYTDALSRVTQDICGAEMAQ